MSLASEPPSSAPSPSVAPAVDSGDSGPPVLGVGTIVWLASELMFFAGLFAAYFTLRSSNDVWPPDGVDLPVARTAVATAVLLASSVTMHQAVSAARAPVSDIDADGQRRRVVSWLGVTVLLGTLFLANLALEYAEASFGPDDHAYGSIFYLMTGFHGLHVAGGVVLLLVVAMVLTRPGTSAGPGDPGGPGGTADGRGHAALEVGGHYWHFVDAVWVAMFTSLYLLPE